MVRDEQTPPLNSLLLRPNIASSATAAKPKPRRVALDLLQMMRRRLLLLLLLLLQVVWRIRLLRRGVIRLLLLLPVLLLQSKTASSTVSIGRAVGEVHLHVVRHLVVRGRGHWRGVAPAGDCGRERG